MKWLRNGIPILGILALAALFFKLPETTRFFECKACSTTHSYVPLIGAGYFALFIAISFLFPLFPSLKIAKGGLITSVLLALILTYKNIPSWCLACLLGHACNILIWTIWAFVPQVKNKSSRFSLCKRLCIALFAPLFVIALFSFLPLFFSLKTEKSTLASQLKVGDRLPTFAAWTSDGRPIHTDFSNSFMIINFISPNCPYCKEQLPILNEAVKQLAKSSYRLINITTHLSSELVQYSPDAEWIEDKDDKLNKLFKISGYPTMFVSGTDGKIIMVIAGVPEQLKNDLLETLK